MQDPRRTNKGNIRHSLTDILFLVISAVISGADEWESIALFGKTQIEWLRKFQPYKHGTPSADTLSRVFEIIGHNFLVNHLCHGLILFENHMQKKLLL